MRSPVRFSLLFVLGMCAFILGLIALDSSPAQGIELLWRVVYGVGMVLCLLAVMWVSIGGRDRAK